MTNAQAALIAAASSIGWTSNDPPMITRRAADLKEWLDEQDDKSL